jgi:hypothetical protein
MHELITQPLFCEQVQISHLTNLSKRHAQTAGVDENLQSGRTRMNQSETRIDVAEPEQSRSGMIGPIKKRMMLIHVSQI